MSAPKCPVCGGGYRADETGKHSPPRCNANLRQQECDENMRRMDEMGWLPVGGAWGCLRRAGIPTQTWATVAQACYHSVDHAPTISTTVYAPGWAVLLADMRDGASPSSLWLRPSGLQKLRPIGERIRAIWEFAADENAQRSLMALFRLDAGQANIRQYADNYMRRKQPWRYETSRSSST